MFIKLLCINTTTFQFGYGDKTKFTINEGDIVNAMVDSYGVHLEYEPRKYSPPYGFGDIGENFISAFDEEEYNKIYQKVSNCTLYFNGNVVEVGDVTIKIDSNYI